ncbi:MAG: hypothetical protein ACK4G3_04770 [bacterium]
MSVYLGEKNRTVWERIIPLYLFPPPGDNPTENTRIQFTLQSALSEVSGLCVDCIFFSTEHHLTLAILQRRGELLWGKNVLPEKPLLLDFEWFLAKNNQELPELLKNRKEDSLEG